MTGDRPGMVIWSVMRRGKVIGARTFCGSLGVWIGPIDSIGVFRRTMAGRIGEEGGRDG